MLRTLVAVLIVFSSSIALADAEGEINYRKGVFKVVGGHMSAIGAMLRHGVYGDNLAIQGCCNSKKRKQTQGLQTSPAATM